MSTEYCKNARITDFTDSEMLQSNQQGGGGEGRVTLSSPPPTQNWINLYVATKFSYKLRCSFFSSPKCYIKNLT